MTGAEAQAYIESRGYALSGHETGAVPGGGPWEILVVARVDGVARTTLRVPSWEDGQLQAAAWVRDNDRGKGPRDNDPGDVVEDQ